MLDFILIGFCFGSLVYDPLGFTLVKTKCTALQCWIATRNMNPTPEVVKYTTPPERTPKNAKTPSVVYGSASSDRPYICPYEGCEKDYIHEYKLKLHLRRKHPGHIGDDNAENGTPNADNELDEASDQDAYGGKRVNGKSQKHSRSKPNVKMPPGKIRQRKGSSPSPATLNVVKKPWTIKDET
ncbi:TRANSCRIPTIONAL REPRESSOR PROTEIN YY [Salix koriyanagi]|uniref:TRANSCRIPTIONAL REPRESSOR PROTEIN YY n=1 Tax=Salix koriyanagi TaxID=2511006 RepID=A0A9Q0T4Q0_9ROSI|nr:TRANSCRIPTIONAL REPRESSOR PROTEIN YY [Salix koriyanagi]